MDSFKNVFCAAIVLQSNNIIYVTSTEVMLQLRRLTYI